MKTIYFIRHGESKSNVANIMSGQGNDIPLTAKGREQAKKAGQDLKDQGIQLIICSPLIRTVQTAKIVAKEIGYDVDKIVTNPLLAEREYGIYEGRPIEIYEADFNNNTVHDSVETPEQLYQRLAKVLESLTNYKENKILIVSHGGAGRAIRANNQKIHHSQMYTLLDRLENAEIYEFQL